MELRLEEKPLWDSFVRHWVGDWVAAGRTSPDSMETLDGFCFSSIYRALYGWIITVDKVTVYGVNISVVTFFLLAVYLTTRHQIPAELSILFTVCSWFRVFLGTCHKQKGLSGTSGTYPVCSPVSANSQLCTKQPSISLN